MFSQKIRKLTLPEPTDVFTASARKHNNPSIPLLLHPTVWHQPDKLYGVNVSGMQILFDEPLSDEEGTRLWTIVDYWSKLKFVTTTPVNTQPIDRGDWIVQVNTGSSASSDIRERDVLRTLGLYLMEGTPVRKTGDATGTRAVDAVTPTPCAIIVW